MFMSLFYDFFFVFIQGQKIKESSFVDNLVINPELVVCSER